MEPSEHHTINKKLIAQAQMLAKELGRTPTAKEFGDDPRTASVQTPIKHFGSWNKFLEASWLKLNHQGKKIVTNEELIAQVQMLAKRLGRTPTAKEFGRDLRTAGLQTSIKHFGSWNKFLDAAGLEVYQRITNEKLIVQAQMLAKELGRTPTAKEFGDDPRTACVNAPINHFGSWNKFLEDAGLKLNQKVK